MSCNTSPRVLSAGLACMDLMLRGADVLQTPESIGLFDIVEWVAGGSVSNTARAIATLGMHVDALTVIGDDPHGRMLLEQWNSFGIHTHWVQTTKEVNTALSVLPIYKDGKRGSYFCPGTSSILDSKNMFPPANSGFDLHNYNWFHYGYPHLTKTLRGEELRSLLVVAREKSLLTSIDVNGANDDVSAIEPAMPYTDVFHANIEEASFLCGCHADFVSVAHQPEEFVTPEYVQKLAGKLLGMGPTVVSITMGKLGAMIFCSADQQRIQSLNCALGVPSLLIPGGTLYCPAYRADSSIKLNTTGAGDSFIGGLIAGLLCAKSKNLTLKTITQLAHASSLHRIIASPKTLEQLLCVLDTLPTIVSTAGFRNMY